MTRKQDPRLVEVVLEEEPAAADAPPEARDRVLPGAATSDDGSGPAPADRSLDRRRRRHRRVRLVGALVVLLAALGLADVVAERRERAALAAVAAVPGVVQTLAEPIGELWRLPRRSALNGVPGRVVAVRDEVLVGLDAATGEPRWSQPLPDDGVTCPLGVPATDRSGAAGHGTFLCVGVVEPGVDPGPAPGADRLPGPEPTSTRGLLHAVGAAQGQVEGPLPGPARLLTGAAVGGDVVLIGLEDDLLTVARHRLGDGPDGPDGAERWRSELGTLGPFVRRGDLRVHGDRDVVAVEAGVAVVLDAQDGRELGRWPGDPRTTGRVRVVSHPGTGFGVWPSRTVGRWHTPDGAPGAELRGEPVEADVDDGSAPEVVLLRSADDDRLHAVDVTTGDVVWDRAVPDRVLVRLGGAVVVSHDGTVRAWDLATGETRWSTPLTDGDDPVLSTPITDGLRIVVPGRQDGALHLTAVRLSDGEPLWRSPLPPGSRYVTVLGDRVVAVGRAEGASAEEVTVLG